MAASKPLNVPISGGMRQDLSEHVAPPGTLVDAINVRFSTSGEVESRPGTSALSAATDADVTLGDIWNGTGILGSVPGGFVVGSEGFAYRYDFAKARLHVAGSYANAEPIGVLNVVAREEWATTSGLYAPYPLSQAAKNGYVATLYSGGNGQGGLVAPYGPITSPSSDANQCSLHVFTEDGALVTTSNFSGRTTTAAFLTDDGSSATDLIAVLQSGTTDLSAVVVTTSATGATLAAQVSVGTLGGNAYYWAACEHPALGWILVYQSNATTVSIKRFVGTSQQGGTVTFTISSGSSPVSVYSDGTNVYVGWVDATGPTPSYRVYDATMTLVTGTTAFTSLSGNPGPPLFGPHLAAGTASFAITYGGSSASIDENTFVRIGELTALGTITTLDSVYQCTAASAPFGPGYLWVRAGGVDTNITTGFVRHLLLDFMALRSTAASNRTSWGPVVALTGNLFVGGSGGGSGVAGWYVMHVSTPQQLTDGSWVMGIPRTVRAENSKELVIAEWLRFSTGGTRQTTRLADGLLVAGMPTLSRSNLGTRFYTAGGTLIPTPQSDGIDLGFPLPPAITIGATAGGTLAPGFYQARAVLERIDNTGTRWRSAPSSVAIAEIGGASFTLALSACINTQWLRADTIHTIDSRFVVHFYVTAPNGSTFYRATPPQGAPVDTSNNGLFSFTMTTSVVNTEVIYTDGGVLGNDCPPSARFSRTTEDRVWFGGLWEPEQLQSSKIVVPGEPPQFSDSPAFRVVLPEPCTGIAYQDGTVIAFTRSAIYAIQGAGPNDQGQGAWDTPRNITRSSGCVNELSIVETSAGVFYQSIRGIELLPRGLGEPVFIGMQVQDTLGTLPIQSASVVSTGKDRTVRFRYGATVAGSVNVLVFDLDTQSWGRDLYPLNISGICDTEDGAVLATVDPDSDSGYGFLIESDSVATDQSNTSAYGNPCTLEWAGLRPFGIVGMGRFQGAVGVFDTESPGYRSGNATMALSVDSATEPGFVFNMNTMSGVSYRRVVPRSEEGTAGKLTLVTEVAGWRFMGWTVELEEIGGTRRVSETEQG